MPNLQSKWTYYQLADNSEQTQKTWAESLRPVCSVTTVPQLLYTVEETEKIGLENLNDLNLFKNDIQPMWEQAANINGGRCMVEISTSHKNILPDLWKKTVALSASEVFDGICGCVFNEKANYRISIWISDPRDSDEIIKTWKELLECSFASFSFSLHNKYSDFSKSKKRFSNKK